MILLTIGMVIGASVGVIIAVLLISSKNADEIRDRLHQSTNP